MRRFVAVLLVCLLATALPAPAQAAGSETVRYLFPTGIVDGDGNGWATPASLRPCQVAPCAEPIVVGSPVFVISEPLHRIEVRFLDDFSNDRVPVTVCVDGTADGVCLGGGSHTFGPFCSGFIIWMTPAPAETVVYAHAASLQDPDCSGTKGYATATWS